MCSCTSSLSRWIDLEGGVLRDSSFQRLRLISDWRSKRQEESKKPAASLGRRTVSWHTKFQHWHEIGETTRWTELPARLGGGEPEGLTLEEAFTMVHDMLVGVKPAAGRLG